MTGIWIVYILLWNDFQSL